MPRFWASALLSFVHVALAALSNGGVIQEASPPAVLLTSNFIATYTRPNGHYNLVDFQVVGPSGAWGLATVTLIVTRGDPPMNLPNINYVRTELWSGKTSPFVCFKLRACFAVVASASWCSRARALSMCVCSRASRRHAAGTGPVPGRHQVGHAGVVRVRLQRGPLLQVGRVGRARRHGRLHGRRHRDDVVAGACAAAVLRLGRFWQRVCLGQC